MNVGGNAIIRITASSQSLNWVQIFVQSGLQSIRLYLVNTAKLGPVAQVSWNAPGTSGGASFHVNSDMLASHGQDFAQTLIWLHTEIRTRPFSQDVRIEAAVLLQRLQRGKAVLLRYSRMMSSSGSRCHELRIVDKDHAWRIIYRIDSDAIVIVEVFRKKSRRHRGLLLRNAETG